ncbi:MAG TPA: permease-like cell division protein FtsX [Polyangia bacterium]|nr:permease-like cell division protein FtsX [Polyangia bacterium]
MTAVWILRRTVLELRRQRWSLAALAAAVALATMLGAGYRLGASPLRIDRAAITKSGGPPAQVIAYLREDLDGGATHRLRDVLTRLPGVQQVALVSGEDALGKLRRQLGERGRLLEDADDGLLPASLEVWLSAGGDPVTRAHQLAWRLARLDGIVDADVIDARDEERVTGWAEAAAGGRILLLATVALGASVILIGGVLVGRRRQRDELRVLLTLGFTRAALLAPVLLLATAAAVTGSGFGLVVAGLARRFGSAWLPLGTALTVGDGFLALLAAAVLGLAAGLVRGLAPNVIDAR